MSALSESASLRHRLFNVRLLGFRHVNGSMVRIGDAKVGFDNYVANISTSFTLSPVSAGVYVLFPTVNVGFPLSPQDRTTLTISVSALPDGTVLSDTSSNAIGTLSAGTDTLSELTPSGTAASLQACLAGIELTFATSAIIPNSVNISITLNNGNVFIELPNESPSSPDNNYSGSAVATLTACFAAGTRIATSTGEVAVESLRIGDEVRSAFGGVVPVRWLGHRRVDCARHPRPMEVWPVRVCRDAFGDGMPRRDLILSPDHAVYVDEYLIPIRYLLNGATIVQEQWDAVTYWHVELPAHDVIEAEGMPAESYLDTGNRCAFVEAEGAIAMTPDFARGVWEAAGCATLVTDGPVVDRVRGRLWRRALARGHSRTHDPRLGLWADGVPLPTRATRDGLFAHLPVGARWIELRSRRGVPLQERLGDDGRVLGVPVSAVELDGVMLPFDSDRFGAGWHDAEPEWRWTNGAALLRVEGATTIRIGLARMNHSYWKEPERVRDAA